MGFQEGDHAYIVVNNMYAKPCTILRVSGDMYVVSIGSGAMRVRESRLFHTAEETGKPFAGTTKPTSRVIQETVNQMAEKVREKLPWDWV